MLTKSLKIRILALLCVAVLIVPAFSACKKEEGEATTETFAFDTGDAYLTNLKDNEKKMLKCSVVLSLSHEEDVEHFLEKNYLVRDAIIKELLTLSYDEAMKSPDLTGLATRVQAAVNAALATETVVGVSFTSFTVV